MNEKIKIWISKAEQIYNSFTERKNLKIWQQLLNEVSLDSPFFFEWRNQFLLYLNSHPFLSSAVYQFINQTFHISEDYYALISEEERKGEEKKDRQYGSNKEKKEFQRIASAIQEENMYVCGPLFLHSHLFGQSTQALAASFDIDRMDEIAEQTDRGAPDDYIYEYLEITENYTKSTERVHRETNGRFGRTAEYWQSIESYSKNLLALSRYGYTSLYEKEQFMWLSCWFGDLDKAYSIAEEILKKELNNLYAASYRAYFLARQGMISERTYSDIAALDKEENLCQIMIKTALAFCEMQHGNPKKVISILSEVLDYSQMPFLNNDAARYTPAFWQHGRRLSGHQAMVLCGGQTAYRDGCKLLRSAYQLLLQKNKFDNTVESVLCMAKAYLHTGAYEQAYRIIYDEQNKQTMIKNKRQTEYFIVMADVLYAGGDYGECIKTAENLDRMLSKNKEVFCGKWGKAAYDRAFRHNLYLLAEGNLLEKNYENACFYSECLMEEDFTAVPVYAVYLKACFFLYKLDKVKQTYYKIHFLFDGWEVRYYAAQAVLRQKEFWRDIQYEEAAEILWAVSRHKPPADYMEKAVSTSSKVSDFPQIRLMQNLIKAGLSDSEEEKELIYEETLSFFHSQKEEGQDMETALIMAQFAMERNKSRDAYEILKNYQKEQKEQIHEPLFWYDCGVCLEAAGKEEEALQIYQKMLQDYGVYSDVCIRISHYYQRRYFLHTFSLEDKNTALQYLQRQEENEDIPPYLELAEYYYQLTEYEHAIEAYLKSEKQMPDLYYQRGYELMGSCFLRIYRLETAEKYFIAAFNWRPERKRIYFETADVLKEREEYKKALWWHQRALKKFGESYDRGYEAIGDLYLLLSEPKKALAYYNIQWILACDRTEADSREGERLKMRYYKRMVYFYLRTCLVSF